jgi:hypothetical protein
METVDQDYIGDNESFNPLFYYQNNMSIIDRKIISKLDTIIELLNKLIDGNCKKDKE